MRALCIGIALMATAQSALAQKIIHWRDISVDATLAQDGTLREVETQTMVFNGDWTGGARVFNVRPRQQVRFEGMRRIDSTGQAHVMSRGDLDIVDNYDFTDSKTLRWRSRLPSDPVFVNTPITYELTYSLSNILVPNGEEWILDHNFGFADRTGIIQNITVRLGGLEPNWQPTGEFPGTWQGTYLLPGEHFVVRVPLRYSGPGEGPELDTGAEPIERYILAGVALIMVASFGRRLIANERANGRLEPLPPPTNIDEKWLDEHVFKHLPEVVGAAWDNSTNASEVAAVLARLCAEGRMRSEVKEGSGLFSGPVMFLELLVPRNQFHGHERKLIDALFESHDTTTDTDRIKKRYKKTGFDPAGKIRKPLQALVKGAAPADAPPKPPKLPSLLIFLGAVVLIIVAIGITPVDAPVIVGGAIAGFVGYFIALGGAVAWRNRVHNLGPWSLFFLAPLGALLAGLLSVLITGVTLASTLALAGMTVLFIALANSIFNQARSRENVDRIAFRRRLAMARTYFAEELKRDHPRMKDAWFPWLIAFGLGDSMDKWFKAFGGTSTMRHHHSSGSGWSSGSVSAGRSDGGWTGFGGGAGFAGGGSSGSWVAAASSMAAGVSAPSSSSGSSGGGGGGGSSGGGGGGGW